MTENGAMELKPCPFCGGKAMFLTITNKSSHSAVGVMFKIKCMKCGTEFPKAMNVRCTWIRTEASEQGKTSEQKQLQIGTGGRTMKILIDIPKEFEVDYNTDRFAEFFHRCLVDMNTCCGNYEQETAEMMEKHLKRADFTTRTRLWSS